MNSLAVELRGVSKKFGNHQAVVLSKEANRREILQSLMAAGEVEHFEMVKPSLHDIFVAIAKPTTIEDSIGTG